MYLSNHFVAISEDDTSSPSKNRLSDIIDNKLLNGCN